MSSRSFIALIAVCGLLARCQDAAADQRRARAPSPQESEHRIVREGMTIDFAITRYERETGGARDTRKQSVHEGDTVTIGFEIRDVGSGNPLSGLNPAAWLAMVPKDSPARGANCTERVKTALSPSLLSRPEVDLNTFYVLALNADATITVVDPVFGYGGTKLLAMIPLQSPGEDWALTSDHNRLFVSMPAANRVAVVDTRSWSVIGSVETGRSPSRLRLQPDNAYLWVDYVADATSGAASGVAVVNTRTLRLAGRIPTGSSVHDVAFSDDNRFAFVLNTDEGTVSVIDVRALRKITDIPVGTGASSFASSPLAQALYVAGTDTGIITVISTTAHKVIGTIDAEPGVEEIRFAPGGRLGFVANRRTNTISVIDAAVNRLVHAAGVEQAPDQLAFSTRYAYVRHHDSEIVRMIPLGEVGKGEALPQLDFPGGQHALGDMSRTTLAPAIVQAADDNAVLVANPVDKAIYYYQEGMAAPMGHFSNYGKEPLAVLVVDRSLRETKPGSYTSTIRLPDAGTYSALLFVNSPRVVHCFDVSIAPGSTASSAEAPPVRIESLTQQARVQAGAAIRLTMRLTDAASGKPVETRDDALALIVSPGVWQARLPVDHVGKGVYAVTVSPPSAGLYDVYVTSPALQLPYTRVLAFEVTDGR